MIRDPQRVINSLLLRSSVVFAITVAIAGCGGGGLQDLQAYVAEVKARKPGALDPLPTIKPYRRYVFRGEGLRDPFQPPKRTVLATVQEDSGSGSSGFTPDFGRVREPLEFFPLDQLRVVGTLGKQDDLWALISAPDGVHRVSTGNYIGQDFGKITSITNRGIEIREIVSDGFGGWLEKPGELALSEEQAF